MHSFHFHTAAGARVPTVPVSLPAQAAAPVQPAPRPSFTEERSRTAPPGRERSAEFSGEWWAVWNAKHGSLRFHGSCCFAGKAIFLNIFFLIFNLLLLLGFSLPLIDTPPIEHDESSRLAVSRLLVRACARSLGLARRNLRNLKKFHFQNTCVLYWWRKPERGDRNLTARPATQHC